ncbi:MAG: hypothetical protein RLZZ444_3185, partial [Pseudomonadota bacterium]
MALGNVWVEFDDAVRLFKPKFADEQAAISIFFHAVKSGFVRSRAGEIRWLGNHSEAELDTTVLTAIDQNISLEAWSHLDSSHRLSDPRRGIFCIVGRWGNSLATVNSVTFNSSDIAKLVSRSGVGGAPFKKVHWQRMTSILLELAFAPRGSGFDQFDGYSDFLTYLESEINGAGDALDRSSIDAEAKQHWAHY